VQSAPGKRELEEISQWYRHNWYALPYIVGEDGMGGTCRTYCGEHKCVQNLRHLKERGHLEYLGVDGKIILNIDLKKIK